MPGDSHRVLHEGSRNLVLEDYLLTPRGNHGRSEAGKLAIGNWQLATVLKTLGPEDYLLIPHPSKKPDSSVQHLRLDALSLAEC